MAVGAKRKNKCLPMFIWIKNTSKYKKIAHIMLWCPLSPVAAVTMRSKCPLTIPGRRYRLPEGKNVSPLRSEGIRRASN